MFVSLFCPSARYTLTNQNVLEPARLYLCTCAHPKLGPTVFDLETPSERDWHFCGFCVNKERVMCILNCWVSSGYSASMCVLVTLWALGITAKKIYQELKKITFDGLLSLKEKDVNKAFFLNYSLTAITQKMKQMASNLFTILKYAASRYQRT